MDNNSQVIYEGVKITIGGKEYIVPGLSLGQMEEMAEKVESLASADERITKEMIQTVSEVCQAALSRNYPDITLVQVKNMLDVRNMNAVIEAVLGASGLEKNIGDSGGNGAKGTPLKRN